MIEPILQTLAIVYLFIYPYLFYRIAIGYIHDDIDRLLREDDEAREKYLKGKK